MHGHIWLKQTVANLINNIANGKYGEGMASRECLHELYYISIEEDVELDEVISRFGASTAIENLSFLETTLELDLTALALMKQYKFTSIFDAHHAAATLEQDEEKINVSTDDVYDKVPGPTRKDPRNVV